tara:strand:+ start:187 stop:1536 length:1350 start_codon:yes stop_codon:yes gene_type:complete
MDKWAEKNTNKMLQLNTAIEHFMTSTNTAPRVARRFTYAIRGMYSVLNKLNVATLSLGKGINALSLKGGIFGKLFGTNKQLKEKTSLMKKMQKYGDFINIGKSSTKQFGRIFQGSQGRADKGLQRRKGIGRALGFSGRGESGPTGVGGFADFMAEIAPLQDIQLSFWQTNKKRLTSVLKATGGFLKFAMKLMYNALYFMVMVGAAVAGFAILWPSIKDAWNKIQETLKPFIGIVLAGFQMIWDGVSGIFDFLFGNASIDDLMNSVFDILGGLFAIGIGLIGGIVVGLGHFIWEFSKSLYDRFTSYMGGIWKENKAKFITIVLGMGVAIVAWLYGFPVLLPALILYSGYKLVKWLADKLTSFGMASGGTVSKGMHLVGERGPELVSLPRGSRVHSNSQSKRMVSNGSNNTINVTINAHSLQDNELRRVARKVGDMINRQVNRSTSSSTIR